MICAPRVFFDSDFVCLFFRFELQYNRLEKILSTNVTIANDNKMVMFDAWVREKYRNRPLTY